MAEGSDEDVPPLEDMSEELDKLRSGRRVNPTHLKPTPGPTSVSSKADHRAVTKTSKKDESSSGFGGFEKGFLFGGSGKKPKEPQGKVRSKAPPSGDGPSQSAATSGKKAPQPKDDIPYLKPKSKASGLELPEVQEAMKETFPFLQTQDWVTEDLLSKVENHPNLSRVFQDPNLSQLLVQFQKDPQAALAAAKDNKDMQGFLQDFCALMGNHFTSLADEDEKMKATAATKGAPLIREVNETSEEEKMREIISKPEVKEVLEDSDVQKLIFLLKNNPEGAHQMVQTAPPPLHQKIQVLIRNGLLAMQP